MPSTAKDSAKAIGLMSLGMLAAWVVCLVLAVGSAKEKKVFDETIDLPLPKEDVVESYEPGEKAEKPEPAYFSEPFKIPVGSNVQVTISTEVQNSYLWVGIALIHEKSGNVVELEAEPSHYSGVEDGESWSEGDKSVTVSAGGLEPGDYVLRLQPVGEPEAQCDSPVGTSGVKRCASQFKVKIVNDTAVVWPGILAFLFIIAFPIIALIRMFSFENKRWSESNVGR
jgi:hypothetical protein